MLYLTQRLEIPAAVTASVTLPIDVRVKSRVKVTLNDGREIQATDKPSFDEDSGFYEFEQLDGKRTRLNKDQIRTVKEL